VELIDEVSGFKADLEIKLIGAVSQEAYLMQLITLN
jgi:hypothetical protein